MPLMEMPASSTTDTSQEGAAVYGIGQKQMPTRIAVAAILVDGLTMRREEALTGQGVQFTIRRTRRLAHSFLPAWR